MNPNAKESTQAVLEEEDFIVSIVALDNEVWLTLQVKNNETLLAFINAVVFGNWKCSGNPGWLRNNIIVHPILTQHDITSRNSRRTEK